jgi:hypothetical protein
VKIARKYWIVLGLAAAVLLGSSSKASAQYYGRPRYYAPAPAYYPPSAYRSGLVLGGSIGFGGLTAEACDICGSGLSLEGHIGGMLNPQAALMLDVWTVIHPVDNISDTTSTLYTGALQFWLTPILWLKGGLGLGNTTFGNNIDGFTGATAFAIMGGAGVELVQRGPFALDLQGRVGHTFFSNADGGAVTQYAFMIGFNWY